MSTIRTGIYRAEDFSSRKERKRRKKGRAKMARILCLFMRFARSLRLASPGCLRCLLRGRQHAAAVVIPMAATAAGGRASVIYRRASMSVCFIKININAGILRCRTSPARRAKEGPQTRSLASGDPDPSPRVHPGVTPQDRSLFGAHLVLPYSARSNRMTEQARRREKRRFRVREGGDLSPYREPLSRTRRSVWE